MTVHERETHLARAARTLREEPQPGWIEISGSVLARVRSVTRLTSPLRMDLTDLDPSAGDAHVSDYVVTSELRRALTGVTGCTPVQITLGLDGEVCREVQVSIAGDFGMDLRALADEAHAGVSAELVTLVGGAAPPPEAVTVAVVDVIER